MCTLSHVFNYHKLTNNTLSSESAESLLNLQSKYCNFSVPPIPILNVSELNHKPMALTSLLGFTFQITHPHW